MKYEIQKRYDAIADRDVFIPQPIHGITLDAYDISTEISQKCTLTRADIAAALVALEEAIGEAVARGDSVRLGDLGTFSVRMGASAASSPEEVTPDNIRRVSVAFRPSPRLKARLAALLFEKV